MTQIRQQTNKVLLMGKAKAGKTSMKSIIFANYLAKDTERLGPTIKIAHSALRFLGDLQLGKILLIVLEICCRFLPNKFSENDSKLSKNNLIFHLFFTLSLDLWDCGGQEKFLQSYFDSHRDSIFRNVAVLIYVFDITSLQQQHNLKQNNSNNTNTNTTNNNTISSKSSISSSYNNKLNSYRRNMINFNNLNNTSNNNSNNSTTNNNINLNNNTMVTNSKNDMIKFEQACGAIKENSPNAKIFVLIHKMDTIPRNNRDSIYKYYSNLINKRAYNCGLKIKCYPTSIWDETLFGAWSKIVCSLLTDETKLQKELQILCDKCKADEIVLFESSTLLFVAHARSNSSDIPDEYRFEKVANIVKQFKLRCYQSRHVLNEMRVSNKYFSAYIGTFTHTTTIAIVLSDENIEMDAVLMNIEASKSVFSKLLSLHVGYDD